MSQQGREGARPSSVTPRVVGATVVTLAGGTLFAGGQPVQAAAFTVTNTNDSGSGSLRQAVLDANGASGADTITITATGVVNLASPIKITDDVTIVGPGSGSLTLDGGATTKEAFYNRAATGIDMSFSGMTVEDFANYGLYVLDADSVTMDDLVVSDNGGGGAFIYADTVTVTDSTFSNNGANGLFVYSSVATTVSGVTASANTDYGVYLVGYGSSTHTVTSSVMNENGSSGLFIYVSSSYTITGVTNVVLTDVTTNNNVGYGTVIGGYYQDVSIDGLTASFNGSTGLQMYYTGELSIANSTMSDNGGSGIDLEYQYGNVVLTDVTTDRNYNYGAAFGSEQTIAIDGLSSADNRIVGLYVPYADSVVVENATISGNGDGIEIHNVGGAVTIRDVEVSDSYDYGVVLKLTSSVTMERVTVADSGIDGVFLEQAIVTMINSTITGAVESGVNLNGVDVFNAIGSAPSNGVAYDGGSELSVVHSTITDNNVGVYADSYGSELDVAHTINVNHSIMSGNGRDILNLSEYNTTPGSTTVTRSIVEQGSAHAGGSNIEADDPLLGALADNGGPTRTMRPAAGSPALSAGDPAIVAKIDTDQRGFNRVTGIIEIGAVEINPGVVGIEAPETVSEDDPGITVTVTRSNGIDGEVSVTLRSCDGTEETVTWADLDDADKTVTFPIPAEYVGQECTIELIDPTGGLELGEVVSLPVAVTAVPTTTVPVTPTTTPVTPTTTPVTLAPTLPPTGGGDRSGPVIWMAGALVAAGTYFARITRRRNA